MTEETNSDEYIDMSRIERIIEYALSPLQPNGEGMTVIQHMMLSLICKTNGLRAAEVLVRKPSSEDALPDSACPDPSASSPLHEESGEWYFWDETWTHRHGPFATRALACNALDDHAYWLDTGYVRGNENGLTERIDILGGPLPKLPKVELCPECKGRGEVLDFMHYNPCSRGCSKP